MPGKKRNSFPVGPFRTEFGRNTEQITLMGSLEFLQQFPDFTPDSLNDLWQNSKAVKLAGGTYCAMVKAVNREIYLINGFHPKQLIHFTEKGRSIVTFTLTGNLDWKDARNNFIGKTNPVDAAEGSLRNELLIKQKELGLQSVSASRNGFHCRPVTLKDSWNSSGIAQISRLI
jgi:hypothetical protein